MKRPIQVGILFLFAHLLNDSFIKSACGQTYSDVTALKAALLTGYDRDVIPVLDQTSRITVNVTAYMYTLQDVDSVKGSLVIPLMLHCTWVDEKLTWTPSDHNNVTKLKFFQNEVWKPPLGLSTPIEFTFMEQKEMHVVVNSDGSSWMSPGTVIESSCNFNLLHWPFDKQVCEVPFFAYDVSRDEIDLSFSEKPFHRLFQENAEWFVDDSDHYVRITGDLQELVFRLYLRRQSGFYVLTIIIPTIGLSVLGAMVFLLPHESGERAGFSITVLLSLAVFLTVIADLMPKTSNPLPRLCIFLADQVVAALLETVFVILNWMLYQRAEKGKEIGTFYKKLVLLTKLQCLKGRKVASTKVVMVASKGGSEGRKAVDDDADDDDDVTWKDVADAVDKIMFVVFILNATFPTIIFLGTMTTGASYET